ncbi:FkbM family methyltransferase [Candidatus Solirubrobacter pratensis]|uniref:FkbM family methyltransferase n=1 Tax=Candidatus Solirubrobacter pratensis TaxID=1298857 RepID=UPI0012DD7208|nr:FkbM family methyltransferase [Candidatus Solirubrobacter pratensis]
MLTGAYDIAEVGFAGSGAILAAGRDVVIESGASVSSRAVVLGPCRIGADAVVAAGAVVTGDVAAGTVVGGVPAKRLGSAGRRRGLPPATDAATDVGRMYLHAEDEVVTPILRDRGGWDSDETEALRNVLRPGATLVDVGANVGYVTLLGARIVGREGRVVAIEPHPDNLRLLRANVARHGLAHVDVVAGAAWDRSGAVKLSACATNTGDHRVGPVLEERPWLEVPALTLDEVLGDTQVDVLKLDTQATEHVALCGARRVLERCRPVVLTEFWPAGIRELGDDPLDALHLYRELGYRLRVLEASELDAVADEELVARVDQRPAPFGGFVTLLLEP